MIFVLFIARPWLVNLRIFADLACINKHQKNARIKGKYANPCTVNALFSGHHFSLHRAGDQRPTFRLVFVFLGPHLA
jgi:hypothetical protein